jgi:cobyrinic acid a,c-diamide synthase
VVEAELARVIVAGLAGDTGKSLVSLGLARALRQRGHKVAPFKKGPDFIDASLLAAAAGVPARNLDTFMVPEAAVVASAAAASASADIAVVEGNRGLFDGMDAAGSHSTAELAKLIGAPLLLVIDATKVTRTVAALVAGCKALDPDLPLAGVILNRVGTARQERVIREAIANTTAIPVVGSIPKLRGQHLPSRHLGLVPAAEHPRVEEALDNVAAAIAEYVDLDAVLQIAASAAPLPAVAPRPTPPPARVRIGVLEDEAFSFYYPENLAALEDAGAELVKISALSDGDVGDIDALYAGGGFPEVHASGLAANHDLRHVLAQRIEDGLPVWAECGGLMYLGQEIRHGDHTHSMVGALPIAVEHTAKPQGHGYVEARVDQHNPFLATGTTLRGHEFHYSKLTSTASELPTMMALERGVGVGAGRDGLQVGNVVASYTHLHALGVPEWAGAVVALAERGGH